MRITPLVGKKLWFGPRGYGGWGWAPISWEGWAVVLGAIAFAIVGSRWFTDAAVAFVVGFVVLGACLLKGTRPGSGRRRKEFQAEQRRQTSR